MQLRRRTDKAPPAPADAAPAHPEVLLEPGIRPNVSVHDKVFEPDRRAVLNVHVRRLAGGGGSESGLGGQEGCGTRGQAEMMMHEHEIGVIGPTGCLQAAK